MVELTESIANFGVLVVIAAVFLYDHVVTNRKMQESINQTNKFLENQEDSNKNISASLDLLNKSINENYSISGRIEDKVNQINNRSGI